MPRTARVVALAAAGLLAALAVPLAEGATTSTAPPAAADHPASLDRYYRQHPTWRRCDTDTPASYQCATITVPVDYAHPDGQTLHLRISRIRTSTPGKRHGVLLSNPGGPGSTGLGDPVQLKDTLSKSVLQRYDLIGFDPRGLGTSSPLHCGMTEDEADSSEPYRPYRAATFAKETARARDIAAKCTTRNGSRLLPHINTRNAARDMDVIRGVLGERKLSYLGWSYGTYLGAVYTQLFPRHSDRMVLDSAVDPNRFGRGLGLAMAAGAEPVFKDWSRLIARRESTYHLGDTPAKVRAAFRQLVARADRTPLLYQGDDPEHQGRALTGADIRSWLRWSFGADPDQAARDVAALRKSRPAPRTARPDTSAAGTADDNSVGLYWAITCGDNTASWPRDPARYQRDAQRESARHPLYGDFAANITPCAFWPRGAEPATHIDNTVGALVVQNQWDPQTPLSAGRAMHHALHGSRMVQVRGGRGHAVYALPGAPACVTRTVDAYLTDGRLPAGDVTCGS
ncbi:alpha/beta fold hydrolase [Streptomyces ferrugineus]|uniref:Alpha/beta fold hydrolase n=1 Tax=Streptomyces ferrugineus TaxID=1413221 RepID=A0A7M2SD79_9ACTN|nr:alpha/beta hydrolase [Streptomyces ferrugineus]QOV33141.1 alpha/beta fold hydrolase [Streptomyces ferrugineus]